MADLTKVLAARLRARRRQLGLTQAALAESAGVSTELISRIERGRCLPSLTTLVACADVLDITPDHLLGYDRPHGAARDVDAIVEAVLRLPRARRLEVRHVAEALAHYHRTRSDP